MADPETGGVGLLTTAEALALIHEAAAQMRAVAEPGEPDPCAWVGTNRVWMSTLYSRPEHPLPIAIPGSRSGGHRFDPRDVREWFAQEYARHQAKREVGVISGEATGILLTASALARELGQHPNTLAKRLREYRVEPVRTNNQAAYYQLGDMLAALTAGAQIDDPDSLPPTDRAAFWAAEARRDAVMQARSELVSTREAVVVLNALCGVLRDGCDLVVDAVESRCSVAPDVLAVIEGEMDSVRRQIANKIRELQVQLRQDAAEALSEPEPETHLEPSLDRR